MNKDNCVAIDGGLTTLSNRMTKLEGQVEEITNEMKLLRQYFILGGA
jgi:hypothetical protein